MQASLEDLINGWQNGCPQSADELKARLYYHLKQVCHVHLEGYRNEIDSTYVLQHLPHTGSLLHQSLIELIPPQQSINHQTQFNTYLSVFIRNILRDEIRKFQTLKRTPNAEKIQQQNDQLKHQEDFLALDSALNHLEKNHPQKAQIFSQHYFLGLDTKVLAKQFKVSLATIYRELDAAKAFLKVCIQTN
ncbi:sigma-70 family RNA polymerase sigma factor [Pseudoalteromonas arctica]|uniref:Sigma-70 family RNA polymerase sigma factor n=1 Tax=Pseudoalteromonas arctica TaxID=394751 RepID=A0A7Y0DSU8_9GAMM|nr:sigma-70 family RNA polymerase sigma factor [Pseudoalteromonas arctica]NMM41022.1 sigma-70 family RNA polymerase sigma factor [Pseudoalteromonas arctica]